QLEADALAVIEFFPGFGKAGYELQVWAAIGQAVEDVGGNGGPGHQEGVDWIPAARILRHGNGQLAVGKCRAGGECGAGKGERKQGCASSPKCLFHQMLPLLGSDFGTAQALSATKWPGAISVRPRMVGSLPTARTGLGISPSISARSRARPGSATGTADRSRRV